MASNGYILDIDTKFIQNLERADKALRQSVESANSLTDRFTQMVNSTSNYSLGVQNVLNVLNQLKGVKIDPATGLLKMGTEARSTAEGVELLKARTEDLKERWVSLSKEIGKKKKGPAAMQIVNEKDLTNINALQTAIANINDILSNASGNKKVGIKTQQQLVEQRKLYSDLLKEAQLTDAQRLESEIKLTNGVITEANKRTEAAIREKKREVAEAIKLANTANIKSPSQIFNAKAAIASARQGLDPNINAEQAQIQALDRALERLGERYKATQTQKEIFAEAKTARDLANTARGYEEVQRAVKAIEEVMPKINPDTKRGQAEIQRLTRAYEKMYERVSMAMANTARSASELRNAITAIENAQKGFNKSTGDGAQRLAALENTHRRLTDALARENGELTTTQQKNVANALAYAQGAQGVMQLTIAYARLRSAAKDINPNTQAGQDALHQLELRAIEVKKQLSEISGSSNKLNGTLSKVGSQLKTVFGLNAIKNFASKLIKIHAEFEKINVSLKVLLGSSARAELIWTRITALALKSPFTIQQLTEATKQMAAYRVESNKLYSSTKMLADISAGLGVEMSRLILAYGQVKAANFLRGTELRQFSEAGIDMLGQLAAYFSEIEERAVSTAEVFDRISKRQVLFEDVDAVLHRVTERGGAFYEMQEKQAETLSGQISNLKDSIQIMFHEIGQSTHGIIVTIVRAIRTIIDTWDKWLPLIAGVITGLITAKTVAIGFKVLAPIFRVVNLALASSRARVILLRNAMLALQAVNPMGWATLAISAITSIGVAALAYSKAVDENAESTEDLENIGNAVGKIFREQADNVRELGEKILAHTIHINNLKSAQEGLNEGDEAYIRNQNAIDEAISSRSALVATLTFNYSDLADGIGAVLNNEKDLRDFLNGKQMHNAQQESLSKILGGITPELIEKYKSAYNKMLVDVQKNNLKWTVTDMNDLDRQAEIIAKKYYAYQKSVADWKEKHDSEFRRSYVGMVSMDTEKGYEKAKEDYNTFMESPSGLIAPSVAEYVRYFDQIEAIALEAVNEWAEINQVPIGTMSDEQVAKAITDFEEVIAYNDLAIAEAELYRRALSNAFNFEWVLPGPELLPWQQRYNNYVQVGEELLGLTVAQMEAIHREFGLIDKSNVTDTQMIEMLDSKIKEYEQIIAIAETYTDDMYGTTDTDGTTRYTRQEVENAKTGLKVAQYERGFWPAAQKKDGGKKKDDYIDEAIKGIKELHNAYKDMQKTMEDGTAKEGAWERYGKGVRESLKNAKINADSFLKTVGDLTSEESVVKAFDELIKRTKDQKKKAEFELAKGEFIWEMKIELDNEKFADAMTKAEDLIAGYELGVELDKLHIPHDFAQSFFDIDITELPDLRLQVMAQYEGLDIGEEEQKEIDETLRKIDELETKAQQERLKKYLQYTRNAIGERGKILLEEVEQMQEIEQAFELTNTLALNKGLISPEKKSELEKLGKSISEIAKSDDAMKDFGFDDEQIEKIKEFNAELNKQKNIAKEGVQRDTAQKLDKFDFEQFKGSEVFQELYSDLSNAPTAALDALIEKLNTHSDQWNKLPIDQVKEYAKLLKDASEALNSNKMPRELLADQRAIISESQYNNIGDASKAMVEAEAQIEQLERERSIVENIINMRAQGIKDEEIKATLQNDQIYLMDKTLDTINKEVSSQEDKIKGAQKFLDAIKLITEAYKKQIENVNKVKTVVDKVFDGWDSINGLFKDGSMSSELLEVFQTLSDACFEMRGMVSETRSAITNLKAAEEGATKFGFALDTASGIIGIIVAAVKVVVGLFNYFTEKENNETNDAIDANMRSVEKLQHAYEDLERQIDKAFTTDSISSLTGELNKNLDAQKKEIEDNIALEEDKKDKDKDQDKIDEWNRQLDEIERQQAENIEKMFSTLTDGVLDNVLDATRGFVDAWYDAYDETGDGMKGLEKNFKEMFANILKQQASLTLISPFIDDFKSQLEEYMNDSRLTSNEATALRAKWEEIAPQMNEALEQYFDSFSDVLDSDYGELSDLEKGIQGMTEDQADVLASYWNSCRFMLSNIDTTLTRLANATLNDDEASNPVVSALKEQTAMIRTIRDMFSSVIDQGSSPHSGAYLKVYMP